MEKAMNSHYPITTDLEYLTALFGFMVQKSKLLRPNFVEEVFELLVAAGEKRTEKLKSGKSQDGHENKEQKKKTLYYARYLLAIYLKANFQNAIWLIYLEDSCV